ncbi:MAG TPA: SAM-dependent chlorinase/fluorinase [Blastocatellia bacterium]|nr:SAM-dependent chlorinase/fluorinase [Blastocatellia bacterium]
MAEQRQPLITLLTDFGTTDYYVGAMKGAIISINPGVEIVDLTHQITAQDIYAGAFTLRCAYDTFPLWTIHVAVVDPGVGSARRPILVMTDRYNFIGPDNGIFSYIYQTENVNRVIHLSSTHYYRQPVSNTFHGRDIFGPCAAWLAKGIEPSKMGEEIKDYTKFTLPQPRVNGTQVQGHVVHVDRFGNCITNLTEREAPSASLSRGLRMMVNNKPIAKFATHFAGAAANELFAYFGSSGFLEIAVPKGSAQRLLEAQRGTEVMLSLVS